MAREARRPAWPVGTDKPLAHGRGRVWRGSGVADRDHRNNGRNAPHRAWWRRLAWGRIAAILFCLGVWLAVGRACATHMWPGQGGRIQAAKLVEPALKIRPA